MTHRDGYRAMRKGAAVSINSEIEHLRSDIERHVAITTSQQAEIERLQAALEDAASWCENERAMLGAVDGYDYHSGEEYGLRRAQIELRRRVHASNNEQPKDIPWDKPNGCCSHCGAPLNAYLIGGYKLHDGTFSVAAPTTSVTITASNIRILGRPLEEFTGPEGHGDRTWLDGM